MPPNLCCVCIRLPYHSRILTLDAVTAIQKQTAKIGSLADVTESDDPDGLRVMYYLVQDLKVSIFYIQTIQGFRPDQVIYASVFRRHHVV